MKRRYAAFMALAAVLVAAPAQALVYLPFMLPMRDGVQLATDFYLPDDWASTPYPTLLVRTPYDKNYLVGWGTTYVEQGLVVVIQDTRGRFASEGVDGVFMTDGWGELQDGYDTVLWIAAMGAWYNGRIVTYGASALGILQYLLAGAAPPGLAGQVPIVAAGDLYEQVFYPGGVFRKEDITSWLDAQGSLFFLLTLLDHPTKDAFWEMVDLSNRGPYLTAPSFHLGGWFDLFSQGTIDAFKLYKDHGAPHAHLVMGPWTHGGFYQREQNELVFPENAQGYFDPEEGDPSIQFLLAAAKGTLEEFDQAPVVYYVMGDVDDPDAPGNQWREADDWPPQGDAEPLPLYLAPGNSLAPDAPAGGEASFVYDPQDPTPSLCGLSLTFNPGPCDVAAYLARTDVLFFATEPVPQPVEITGRVLLRLSFRSNRTDTDLAAFLVDVYPDGRHMLFLHGIRRASLRETYALAEPLVPGEAAQITIDLWSTSLVLNTGHRLGLFVASANYPMHERNLNNFGQHPTQMTWAENTLLLGPGSALLLPVVGDSPWEPADDDTSPDDDTTDDDSGADDDASDDDALEGDSAGDDDGGCCG